MERTILHLSDLHCDSSTAWKQNFDYLVDCVLEIVPDIIVITGDCVDHPDQQHFDTLTASFEHLITRMKEDHKEHLFYIIPVPGNHDYYNFGMKVAGSKSVIEQMSWFLKKIAFWKKSSSDNPQSSSIKKNTKLCERNLKDLWYPLAKDKKEILSAIFKKYHLAIYPLDSNDSRDNKSLFAEGYIADPSKKFAEYEEVFKGVQPDSQELERLNITLLHHHPLPLPISLSHQDKEPFLILKNAYEFLFAAEEHHVNVILHGHEHVGGLSLYKTSAGHEPMLVFSCGSSSHKSILSREIKLVLIKQSGAVSYKNISANNRLRRFNIPQSFDPVVTYGNQRKIRSSKIPLPPDDLGYVSNIKAKKKLVTLENDGTAYIRIVHEGIKWKCGVDQSTMVVQERLQSDVGRIHYGWGGFCEERQRRKADSLWRNPNSKPYDRNRPIKEENFILKIRPKPSSYLVPNHRAHCEIEYPFFNGFAITQADHAEIHHNNSGSQIEFCSIEAMYPTELLELTIKFPSLDYFPEERDINSFALKKKTDSMSYMEIIESKFSQHTEETDFLNLKLAKRYSRELCQVSLVVRYPQPGILYSLIWDLPKSKHEAKIGHKDKDIARKLRLEFLEEKSPRIDDFYNNVCGLEDNSGLNVVILGIDTEHRVMRVMKGPEKIVGNTFSIGRGLAGKALRSRKVQYYQKEEYQESSNGQAVPHIEILGENFNPYAALALPLMYPRIDQEKWHAITGDDGEGRCPIFSVISLFADNYEQFFDVFRDAEESSSKAQEILENVYSGIFKALVESFDNILETDYK